MVIIFVLVVLVGIIYAFISDDKSTIIINNSDEVLVEDTVTVTATDNIVDKGYRAILDTDYYEGLNVTAELATVSSVYSDRYFVIHWDPGASEEGYLGAFLSDDLDLGMAESRVVVRADDVIRVSGYLTKNASNLNYETGRDKVLAMRNLGREYVLVVQEIEFL